MKNVFLSGGPWRSGTRGEQGACEYFLTQRVRPVGAAAAGEQTPGELSFPLSQGRWTEQKVEERGKASSHGRRCSEWDMAAVAVKELDRDKALSARPQRMLRLTSTCFNYIHGYWYKTTVRDVAARPGAPSRRRQC